MDRPNELIKELQDFNEQMYGYELSRTECKELTDYISRLEKALDNACGLLERFQIEDAKSNDLLGKIKIISKEQWKEWSLEESEKE